MEYRLTSEIFLVPSQEEGRWLLYAPLRGHVVHTDSNYVNLLARLDDDRAMANDEETTFLKALADFGILNGGEEKRPGTYEGCGYAPTRTTLLISNQCNLACKYCYASSGVRGSLMPPELGERAVDFIVANAVEKGGRNIALGFHGGGEPTLAWETLTQVTRYARAQAEQHGLELSVGVATNACISERQATWLAQNANHVTISLDGPPDIQDRQRPMPNGSPSSPLLERTVSILEKNGTAYSFQATVTRESAPRMADIADYVGRAMRPTVLKMEPVTSAGRFRDNWEDEPGARAFADGFREAQLRAATYGLPVTFSGLRLGGPKYSHFCGAFGEPFAVTPDGKVSACFESFCGDSEYAPVFVIGQYDKKSRGFVIDRDKLELLRRRNIYRLERCLNCFCKYSCAGDCATRNFRISENYDLSTTGSRCEMIRLITARSLYAIATGKAKKNTGVKDNDGTRERQAQ